MSYQRSNISTSLRRKRQMSLLKKIGIYSIFILFVICLVNYGLTANVVRIKNIVVSGNNSVATEDILKIVNTELDKVYLKVTPTDNILLLRSSIIENKVLNTYKKIGKVDVIIRGITSIEIAVKERKSDNLWCKGTPAESKGCYFMDLSGFIFEDAPIFSNNSFPEYFGLISNADPIGQIYFGDNFRNISNLYNALKTMSFQAQYFNALNEHEYEIYIFGGGKILINDKKSFESSLTNLQALVDNKYIANDSASLKKIKYVDLRFGNKVNFELNK